ncbi:hypothetical protein N4G58_18610 [Edwardsiella piscicida]|nr:hypothetical protein N4G58_18610 [Edwardsiella piscicida]
MRLQAADIVVEPLTQRGYLFPHRVTESLKPLTGLRVVGARSWSVAISCCNV